MDSVDGDILWEYWFESAPSCNGMLVTVFMVSVLCMLRDTPSMKICELTKSEVGKKRTTDIRRITDLKAVPYRSDYVRIDDIEELQSTEMLGISICRRTAESRVA